MNKNRVTILASNESSFTGLTNFLRRIGVGFECFNNPQKIIDSKQSRLIIVGNNFIFREHEKDRFMDICHKNQVIFSGYSNICSDVFESKIENKECKGCWWPILTEFKGKKRFIAPPCSKYIHMQNSSDITAKYPLYVGKGYFLSREHSKADRLEREYFICKKDNLMLFSIPVFEYIGDILLGNERIEEFKDWYNPLFWVDEFMAVIKEIIEDNLDIDLSSHANYISREKSRGIVVLRHDVDSSRDTSYLDYEKKHELPATYALLIDKNKRFWLSELKNVENIEISFHYNTYRNNFIDRIMRKFFPKKAGVMQSKPDIHGITGEGLHRKFKRAQKKGISCRTLNRHGAFIYLPEHYYAMENLCRKESEVLGGGNIFRATVLQEGADRPAGMRGYICQYPGTIIPFWYPVKPFLKINGKVQPASYWESTHLMETDEVITDKVLGKADNLPGKGVYTFGFHPAHAKGKNFHENGCFPWFKYVVKKAENLGYEFLNLSQVYERANSWEEDNTKYYLE